MQHSAMGTSQGTLLAAGAPIVLLACRVLAMCSTASACLLTDAHPCLVEERLRSTLKKNEQQRQLVRLHQRLRCQVHALAKLAASGDNRRAGVTAAAQLLLLLRGVTARPASSMVAACSTSSMQRKVCCVLRPPTAPDADGCFGCQ